MNLQNLQVRELTIQEEKEIEGGGWKDWKNLVRKVFRAVIVIWAHRLGWN